MLNGKGSGDLTVPHSLQHADGMKGWTPYHVPAKVQHWRLT